MIPDPPATDPRIISSDLDCRRCAYNLRTRPWDSLCPECALPVAASRLPDRFTFTRWSDLRRLRLGLAIYIAAILIATLGHVQQVLAIRFLHHIRARTYYYFYGLRAFNYSGVAAECLINVAALWLIWPYTRSAGSLRRRRAAKCAFLLVSVHFAIQLGAKIIWTVRSGSLTERQAGLLAGFSALGAGTAAAAIALSLAFSIRYPRGARQTLAVSLIMVIALLIATFSALTEFRGLFFRAAANGPPLTWSENTWPAGLALDILVPRLLNWSESLERWTPYPRSLENLAIVLILAAFLRQLARALRAGEDHHTHPSPVASSEANPQ